MAEKVVVLGAGFAGLTTALRLSRQGFRVEVIDIKSFHEFTPDIVNLYRGRVSEEKLRRDLHRVFRGTGVDFSREVVEGIRPNQKMVDTNAGSHDYDYLVVALGGEPRTFGVDITEVGNPYSLEETKKITRELGETEEITVVGAGYVGVEIAAELAELGKNVTIIDGATRPMPASNERASHKVLDYLNAKNINFRPGKRAVEVEEGQVTLDDGKTIESDRVIWCAGVQASEVVRESFNTDPAGMEVDKYLRSVDFNDIFVAGDAADTNAQKTAHNAFEQAKTIALNLGRDEENMKSYGAGNSPLVVSLGDTGMVVYGEQAVVNRGIRSLKGMVRRKYWADVKREELLAKML